MIHSEMVSFVLLMNLSLLIAHTSPSGVCCSCGSGDYTVSKNGVVMISMDDKTNFGSSETKSFGSVVECGETLSPTRFVSYVF